MNSYRLRQDRVGFGKNYCGCVASIAGSGDGDTVGHRQLGMRRGRGVCVCFGGRPEGWRGWGDGMGVGGRRGVGGRQDTPSILDHQRDPGRVKAGAWRVNASRRLSAGGRRRGAPCSRISLTRSSPPRLSSLQAGKDTPSTSDTSELCIDTTAEPERVSMTIMVAHINN